MYKDWLKSGSSSKPSMLHSSILFLRRVFCQKYVLLILGAICALFALLTSYYLYLSNLYLLDEVYDIRGPGEYRMNEKLTIRVIAPKDRKQLSDFVLHYSICPVVHEIQVIWPFQHAYPPSDSYFKYTTVHGKVNIYSMLSDNEDLKLNYEKLWFNNEIKTESVALLDSDVFISCADLQFSYTVWQSSRDSLVGYFPRVVSQSSSKGKNLFEYQNPSSVFWNGHYSILLSSGMIVKTSFLKDISESLEIKSFLQKQPQCFEYVLSVWNTAHSNSLPIWINIDYSLVGNLKELSLAPILSPETIESKSTKAEKEKKILTNEDRGVCLTQLAELLKVNHFPDSRIQSTIAKTHLFW